MKLPERPKLKSNARFVCTDPKVSPMIGVPVRVKKSAMVRRSLEPSLEGGVIVEDWTAENVVSGSTASVYLVKHSNDNYIVWNEPDLIEVGGIGITFTKSNNEWEL